MFFGLASVLLISISGFGLYGMTMIMISADGRYVGFGYSYQLIFDAVSKVKWSESEARRIVYNCNQNYSQETVVGISPNALFVINRQPTPRHRLSS